MCFTRDRFTSATALQFYAPVPALKDLITYIQLKICPTNDEVCAGKALNLNAVDYLDIDYDAISQSLVLSAFRCEPPTPGTWNAKFQKLGYSAKIEVGVLASERATEPEELSLGGFLTTIGESDKPKPTRFSFPSRHHDSPQSSGTAYFTTFPLPTGLHPTLRLTFPSTFMSPPLPTCALHTYLILPSSIFPDKYQLSSPLFLASMNLRGLRAISGETDLEAPAWVVKRWGSALLMELAPPSASSAKASLSAEGTPWHASIPLHLRYLSPSHNGTTPISVPCPLVFWACPTDEGTKMGTNPFDRVHLGYESLFGPRTMFYHLRPEPLPWVESSNSAAEGLVLSVQVPVLEAGWKAGVEWGTVGVVLLGFMWVVGKVMGTRKFLRGGDEGRSTQSKRD
ncbi:protease B nonderepressible form [Pseudocyphellaria aurata]|nr:protease B nonderepressible form [Pseudocyphellaria aurata]